MAEAFNEKTSSMNRTAEPALLVVSGIETGRRLLVERDVLATIGRDSGCSFRLKDPAVSRRHCEVVVCGKGLEVCDSGSRWGTFVNGQRIDTAIISVGDRLLVGETEFVVCDATGDSQTTTFPFTGLTRPPRYAEPGHDSEREARRNRNDRIRSDEDVLNLVGTKYLTYRIDSIIASARTGAILRSYCERLKRDVALKVFWPRLLSSEPELARFVRSMETAIPVRDENIVSVFSAGRHRGVSYTASEIVEGESVAQLIDRLGVCGMLDWRRVLRIAIDITKALVCADQHKMVHRNINPRNLLIRASDDCAKLNDLVFAKAIEGTQIQQITQAGEVLGDAFYMSPEQIAQNRPIDCRSDMYSLGASLYAILTGRPPLEGRNQRETLQMIELETPAPPTEHHLSISPLMEGEVMRLLEKRPEDRPQTPGRLLHDLQRVATYENVCVD